MSRALALALLCVACVTAPVAAADDVTVSLTAAGALDIAGGFEVPPYAEGGRWTEGPGKSSTRWVTRHFLFILPGQPPVIELYVARDVTGARPDAAFGMGLVTGFLEGFAPRAGFSYGPPVFEDAIVGTSPVKRCRVELSGSRRQVWLYAYVFPRQPSLTFLALSPRGDAARPIEAYLGSLRPRAGP